MNFKKIFGLKENENIKNIENWEYFSNPDDLEKFFDIIKQFDSYEKFLQFMEAMKSIPTISQIMKLTHHNSNLNVFEFLKSQGYFNLLDLEQKYYLFVEACEYDSIDIAMLIFSTSIDLEGVKNFMQNYLAQVATNIEYMIFRKIWEKNIIIFNQEEIEEIFFYILGSSNIEFIEWFYSLNLINFKDQRIREKIGWEILDKASSNDDYKTAIFICSQYIKQ